MGIASTSQGKAMYMASSLDKSWLLSEQRKLYERSRRDTTYIFHQLWGLLTDPRNLRIAFARVAQNKGRRTSGVDGRTVWSVLSSEGADAFLSELRTALRKGAYVPSPAKRVLIPKNGQPGKFRPLGIPTVADRVVQAALKNILEPIFEADFYPLSYGFRPGKSAHGALEHLRLLLRPKANEQKEQRLPYQWAVEGDIKGCFDNIDHHGLMVRVRRRIGDGKVNRLVSAFLKSGVLSEGQFLRSDSGTPQGGILSPLLANIALSAIEERYERHGWPRQRPKPLTDPTAITKRASFARLYDRRKGLPVCFPIRYADDFILLVGASSEGRAEEAAHEQKAVLARELKAELSLELSEAKTLVTSVTRPLRFLGHHVRVRAHPIHGRLVSTAVVPRDRSHLLRERIKDLFRRTTTGGSLASRLRLLNPMLRGWCNFYRHAWGAKRVFYSIDHYVRWTIFRWLRKKHPRRGVKWLLARYDRRKPGCRGTRWNEGGSFPFETRWTRVQPFRLAWLTPPDFAITDGEPGA